MSDSTQRMASDIDQMTEVAMLYYLENVTQEAIAKRFDLSRAKVSRLLKRARDEGIVEVRVLQHPAMNNELERALVERFKLDRALIAVDHSDPDTQRSAVASLVANYLNKTLSDGMIVAVGMGRNVGAVADNVFLPVTRNCTFVCAIGGSLKAGEYMNPDHICRRLALRFGGESESLYAPALVANYLNKTLSDGMIVAVVDGDQGTVELEALHQGAFQLIVHRRVLQHAHFDNAFIARTFEQAADFCPRQVKALGDGFLSDVFEVIEHRHFGHLIDIAGNALATVTHGDGLPFRRQRHILPTLAPPRPLLMPIALDRIDARDLGPGTRRLELRGQECSDDALGQLGADHPCADGQDLCIVALARALRRVRVMGLRRANPQHLVRRDGHADPGAAHQHAQALLPGIDGIGHGQRDVRVEHRRGGMGAEVGHWVAQRLDMAL